MPSTQQHKERVLAHLEGQWFVEIRPYSEDESDAGFRRMAAQSEHDAGRIARGASINLNHEKYYTLIVRPNCERRA